MSYIVIAAGVIALLAVVVFVTRLLSMSESDIRRDINKIVPVDKFEKQAKEAERGRNRWRGRRRRR